MLLSKKVIFGKMFRDPENGGSDRIKTDLRATGVPKNSFVINLRKKFKMRFMDRSSAPSKEGLLLKNVQRP